MFYDDVDLTIVDSNDSFGVVNSNSSKITASLSNVIEKPVSRHTPRSTMKREMNSIPDQKSTRCTKKGKIDVDLSEYEKVVESKSSEVPSSDFKSKPAVTFQEKLSVLEERDKHLRATIYRDTAKNMNVITAGTCPDMCPEKERLLREIHCFFSVFEGQVVQNEIQIVPELLVKEYSRSSADQEEPLPHELRPEPVLVDTMSHILLNIIPKIEESSVDVGEWYNFCWDRLRSLRKDIIQQQLCSKKIVQLLEQSARFHICCFDLLSEYDIRVFDEKINAENLVNCLQMLITMYEDLEICGHKCENETEFRIYMMLLLFDSGDIPDVLRWNDDRGKHMVEEAEQIFFAFKLKLYTKFYKLVKKTSYLNACILQRYFVQMKAHTLNVFVTAYTSGNQSARFSLPFALRILHFDNDEDIATFVRNYGFKIDFRKQEMSGSKSSFSLPEIKPTCKTSDIVIQKRLPVLEAVTRITNYQPERKICGVHSSFNEMNLLSIKAWDASDQKAIVIERYGNIYEESMKDSYVMEEESEEAELSDKTEIVDEVKVEEPLVTAPTVDRLHYLNCNFEKRDSPPARTVPSPVLTSESKPIVSFTFTLPKPIKLLEYDKSPTELPSSPEPITFVEQQPAITSPNMQEEIQSSVDMELESQLDIANEEIIIPRKSEEVVKDLTIALNEFEDVYWNHFGFTKEDRMAIERFEKLKENAKLRRIVKKRLKRLNAKKIARLWRKKIEIRQKKRENFVGILHLSPEQYFRIWGVHRKDDSNVVKDVIDTSKTLQWSSGLLVPKTLNLQHNGDKLSLQIMNNIRLRYGKTPPVAYFKLLISMPDNNDSSYRSFVIRAQEFCRVLYYRDGNRNLGDVEITSASSCRVLSSINVKIHLEEKDFDGLSSCVIYVNDHWESLDTCLERILNICGQFRQPLRIAMLFSDVYYYKSDIEKLLSHLLREKIIGGWSSHKWNNFFSIPKVVFKTCTYVPTVPMFQVQNLKLFIENSGAEFFSYLCYMKGENIQNNPNTFIKIYNEFVNKLQETVSQETAEKFNLSLEFLSNLVNNDYAKNNLNDENVTPMINKFSLISFTKWPPKSTKKLIKIITEYCRFLEREGSLLPNVIRLINPDDDVSVEEISNKSPWLNIVELWFRHHVEMISKKENVENIFIIYEEKKISSLIEEMWLKSCG